MKWTLATLGALSLLLAGCSGSGKPPAETTKAAATNTSAVPTSPPPPPGSNPSTPQESGATLTFRDDPSNPDRGVEADVTVFAANQNIAPSATPPASGGHWVGADVQTCLKKNRSDNAFKVGWSDWSVSDAGNAQYPANSNSDAISELPTPQYPFSSETLVVGECVRGWVMFPVAGDTRIIRVKYKPDFANPGFWSVS